MKLKQGVVLHDVGTQHLGVTSGKAAKAYQGMMKSNDTADFLLKKLQNETTPEELVAALCTAYDVEEAQAALDVDRIIKQLQSVGLLEG